MGKPKTVLAIVVLCLNQSFAAALKADFNNDRIVNLQDFSILTAAFSTYNPFVDIYPSMPDGRVDIFDLVVLSDEWLDVNGVVPNGRCDFNGDRIVSAPDLAMLVSARDFYDYRFDISPGFPDGVIDLLDLCVFSHYWLQTYPATWYVDPVNGNDDNTGIVVSPWATLARAQTDYILCPGQINKVLDGDTVILLPSDEYHSYGSFVEDIPHSRPVIYRAQGPQKPYIPVIKLGDESTNLVFENIWTSRCIFDDTSNIQLLNCLVRWPGSRFDAPSNAVQIIGARDINIQGCEISNCRTAIQGSGCSNISIIGNNIFGVMVDAIEAGSSNDVLILRNHIHDLKHPIKCFKDQWIEPQGFQAVPGATSVVDRQHYDLTINIPTDFNTGLITYLDLPENPESGSNTASGDFSQVRYLVIGIEPNTPLYAGDLSVRVCSDYGCNSGYIEDIPLLEYVADDSNSTNWGFINFPPNTSTLITIDSLDENPHVIDVYDGNVVKASYTRGHLIGKFTTKGDSPMPARSIGLVLNNSRGPCTIKIDAGDGFEFSNGAHQDFIAGAGSRWVIKDNIVHDGIGQGIFSTNGIFSDILIEQNLFYDFFGTSLSNMKLGGNSIIRNNTMLGFCRVRTNSESQYGPNDKLYLAGNVSFSVNNKYLDNIIVYNNLIGGSISLPVYSDLPVCSFWDYNFVQTSSVGTWGIFPWPEHSYKISQSPTGPNMLEDFFVDPNFTHANGRLLDYHLKESGPKSPSPVNFANFEIGVPARGLGNFDPNGEFILDNGLPRDPNHHSIGAYER